MNFSASDLIRAVDLRYINQRNKLQNKLHTSFDVSHAIQWIAILFPAEKLQKSAKYDENGDSEDGLSPKKLNHMLVAFLM
jgi:hypothetical protein